jgi:signal transduction histidine kinase
MEASTSTTMTTKDHTTMSDTPGARRPGTQLKVLLVEDDENQRALIAQRLRGDPSVMQVLEAPDLGEALRLLTVKKRIDAVVLDPGLPDAQGTDGIVSIRTAAPGKPIIILTGRDDEDFGLETVSAGADEFVPKTVATTRSLAQTIHYAIERRRSTEHVRRNHHLASLGSLAGGVAHEINNPATIILNCAELILDEVDTGSEVGVNARHIMDAAKRVAEITGRLLTFSRDQGTTKTTVSLPGLLNDSLHLIGGRRRSAKITVEQRIDDGLPPIDCLTQDIQQLFIDLIVNAHDATLARHGEGAKVPPIVVSMSLVQRDGSPHIRTRVEDQGGGISAAVLERIFDPFFSESSPSVTRVGMGLSIARRVADEHGGHLWIESSEGHGTTAFVDLPVVPPQ